MSDKKEEEKEEQLGSIVSIEYREEKVEANPMIKNIVGTATDDKGKTREVILGNYDTDLNVMTVGNTAIASYLLGIENYELVTAIPLYSFGADAQAMLTGGKPQGPQLRVSVAYVIKKIINK